MKITHKRLLVFLIMFSLIIGGSVPDYLFPGKVYAEEDVGDEINDIEETALDGKDFSSMRLIVSGDESIFTDEDRIISSHDGVYLLQYDDIESAEESYVRLAEEADGIEVESRIGIASDETGDIMTEEENPFTEIETLMEDEESKYNIAVIDTGAVSAEGVISVLGDDGFDNHGHGQRMIDLIKEVAPDKSVVSIKAIGADGYGNISAVYAAIKLATELGVDVISLSLSAPLNNDSFLIEEAINEAVSKGIVVVGAAGNNGKDASSFIPGCIESAVIVGASDYEGNKKESSNYGETVDLFLPAHVTSDATALAAGYIALNGNTDGIEEYVKAMGLFNQGDVNDYAEEDDENEETDNAEDEDLADEDYNSQFNPLTYEDILNGIKNTSDYGNDFSIQDVTRPSKVTYKSRKSVTYGSYGVYSGNWCSVVTVGTNTGDTVPMLCVETNVAGMHDAGFSTYSNISEVTNQTLRKVMFYGNLYGQEGGKQDIFEDSYRNVAREIAMGLGANANTDGASDREMRDAYIITHHAGSKIFIQNTGLSNKGSTWTWNMNSKLESAVSSFLNKISDLPNPPDNFHVFYAFPDGDNKAWSQAYMFAIMEEVKVNNDPTNLVIKKIDYNNNSTTITDTNPDAFAVFKVQHFDVNNKQTGTWYFKTLTKEEGGETCPAGHTNLNMASCLYKGDGYSSSPLFVENGNVYWPEGKISVEEIIFPEGYNSNYSPTLTATVRNVNNTLKVTWTSETKNMFEVEYEGRTRIPGYQVYKETVSLANFYKTTQDNLSIVKVDGEGNLIRVEDGNAVFRLDVFLEGQSVEGDPDRTFYFQGYDWGMGSFWDESQGQIYSPNLGKCLVKNSKDYQSSENYYAYRGHLGFPAGATLKFTEVEPPDKDYSLLDKALYAKVYETKTVNSQTGLEEISYRAKWTDETLKLDEVEYLGNRIIPYNGEKINNETIAVKNAKNGKVKVKKVSASPELTEGNPGYSLEGAVFGIYKKEADAKDDKDGSKAIQLLQTDKNGDTQESGDLLPGTYWIKEIKAPRGYKRNSMPYSVTVKPKETSTVTIKNEPVYDNNSVEIYKNSSVLGYPAIINASAIFKVEYFANDSFEGTPSRTWYYKTIDGAFDLKDKGFLSKDHENSPMFTTGSKVVFPLGTIRISEIQAPKGYFKSNEVMKAKIELVNDEARFTWITNEVPGKVFYKKTGEVNYINEKIPEIHTTARDGKTGSSVGTIGKVETIIDKVIYKDLTVGNEYKVTGSLYYKTDGKNHKKGDVVLNSKGEPYTQTLLFKPEKSDGSIELVYNVDSSVLRGETVVVFEDLYRDDVKIATHSDIEDTSQSIDYPDIRTTAKGKKTGNGVMASDEESIVDTVSLNNLVIGKEYVIKGVLINKETGSPVKNSEGKEVTSTKTIKAEKKDMTVDLEFRLDDVSRGSLTTVVFEELRFDNQIVAEHKDINDEGQTLHMPTVKTEAKDKNTGTHTGKLGKTTIVDKVTIDNTVPNIEYRIRGVLVYAEDCTDSKGEKHSRGDIIAEHEDIVIKATDTKIVTDIPFEVDSSLLDGITTIVFEDVFVNNIRVAMHHDYKDNHQKVCFPKVGTKARDNLTMDNQGSINEKTTIVDTVKLSNLTIDDQYQVVGRLMKTDGTQFEIDGQPVTASSEWFSATSKEMTKELEFHIDSTLLENNSLVIFEKLFSNRDKNIEVARHEDVNDVDQMMHFPKVETTASDGVTLDNVGKVGETETIIDKVLYKNLIPGKEYTVLGDLHYKEDFVDSSGEKHMAGDLVLDKEGNEYTSSVTFIPEEADGYVNLTYNVDSELLRGSSVVVFESIIHNDTIICSHSDIEDEDQRIDYPEVLTTACSVKTGDHVGDSDEITYIKDIVELKNLRIGETYKVKGMLMDRESGEPVLGKDGKEIKSETLDFEATEKDMTVEMEFMLVGKDREEKTTVVFEQLIHNDVIVSYHADLEDDNQSIFTPKIRTKARDGNTGNNIGEARRKAVIIDTVELKNLVPGNEYTVSGFLMNKKTGEIFKDADGKEVRSELVFTAEERNMTCEMMFKFNGSDLNGTTLVVFEELVHEGYVIAAHFDLNDESQSVLYPEIPEVPSTTPGTGDNKDPLISFLLFQLSLLGILIVIRGNMEQKA